MAEGTIEGGRTKVSYYLHAVASFPGHAGEWPGDEATACRCSNITAEQYFNNIVIIEGHDNIVKILNYQKELRR